MRRLLLLLLGMLGATVALELALRVLPTSTYSDTGYHIDPLIITYRPGHRFRSSWGWDFSQPQSHRVNNLGFLSARDFTPDPGALALIGDSFVDASMLPEPERVGGQLQRLLPGRAVYAMGGPGSSLLDYAERVRYAAEKLEVRDFVVVVERADLRHSYCGSGNIHGPCLDRASGAARTELQPPPSTAKLYLRHSALLQYLLGHLRFDPAQRVRRAYGAWRALIAPAPRAAPVAPAAPAVGAAVDDFSEAELARVMETFFARIAPYRRGRLLMVFDCDRLALERGRAPGDAARSLAMALARAHGAEVIDTAPSFAARFAATGRRLEVSPLDAHWNATATGLVAADIAAVLAH